MNMEYRHRTDVSRPSWGGMSVALVLVAALFLGRAVNSAEQPKTLDEQLFDVLDDDLFSDLEPLAEEDVSRAAAPQGDSDLELQRQLGGEDLGGQRASGTLREISESMQRVRERLQRRDASASTRRMQSNIAEQLEKLIELRQKQKSSQSSRNSQSKSQQKQSPSSSNSRQQSSQQQQGSAKPGDGNHNSPSGSSERVGQVESTIPDGLRQDELMNKAWGHLPAASRKRLQSARPEQFLPKYSRLIEEYFRRLAQESEE